MAKPRLDRFAVVTATTSPPRAKECLWSWRDNASYDWPLYVVWNGTSDEVAESNLGGKWITQPEIGGVVPMFAQGVRHAIAQGADIIACLHDDVLIEQVGWDMEVIDTFEDRPRCGLAGFGGGTGLGDAEIYLKAYDPMQLARVDFVSNLRDAEAHGRRVEVPTRVACLDGLSQIGRAEFFEDAWPHLQKLGLIHHAYDSALGALAKRAGWEVWMIPVHAHHFGGRTAVGDPRYQDWAKSKDSAGDSGLWRAAHRAVYDDLHDVLPIRI